MKILRLDLVARQIVEFLNDILDATITNQHFLVVAATLVGGPLLYHIAHHHLNSQPYFLLVWQFEQLSIISQKVDVALILERSPAIAFILCLFFGQLFLLYLWLPACWVRLVVFWWGEWCRFERAANFLVLGRLTHEILLMKYNTGDQELLKQIVVMLI